MHALGDLADAEVTQRLRAALPWPAKLGVTGEDAVEIALRTVRLATERSGIVALEGAYHGKGASSRSPRATSRGGLLRAKRGDAGDALERGVLVVPAGELVQATPPLAISDDEVEEALRRLA